jgi:hypothetical protein
MQQHEHQHQQLQQQVADSAGEQLVDVRACTAQQQQQHLRSTMTAATAANKQL